MVTHCVKKEKKEKKETKKQKNFMLFMCFIVSFVFCSEIICSE